MRKLLITLLAVATLSSGAALAQNTWAGVSGGWPGAALHFGVENVFAGLDVRANLGYNYGSPLGLAFGADLLYGLDVDTGVTPLDVYVGGGFGLGFGTPLSAGINLLVGAEYRLVDVDLPEGGVFFEAGPVFWIAPAFTFGFAGRLGFNYHF